MFNVSSRNDKIKQIIDEKVNAEISSAAVTVTFLEQVNNLTLIFTRIQLHQYYERDI